MSQNKIFFNHLSSGMRPTADFAVFEWEVCLTAGPESMPGGKNCASEGLKHGLCSHVLACWRSSLCFCIETENIPFNRYSGHELSGLFMSSF